MKLLFSKNQAGPDDAIVINDISVLDIMADDGEANLIVIEDHYLAQYSYEDAGKVLNFIMSKLRIGGKIIITQTDADMACYQLTRGMIDLHQFNEMMFPFPISSFISIEIIESLLTQAGIKIDTKSIVNLSTAIITGVRV